MSNSLFYEKLEGKCAEYLKKYFTSSFRPGYLKCEGFVLPEYFQNFGDRIRKMEIRPDDVWVCSVPKTGTTWVQEMVWCIANDVDLKAAKECLNKRFPFLEFTALVDDRQLQAERPEIDLPETWSNSFNYVERCPSPRFIKSHLPFVLLPEKLQHSSTNAAKIVYVTRNPRDTCISYYHHCRNLEGYEGDFDIFCELFLSGAVTFLPYWEHVFGYWQRRERPNILFVTYEEMKKDLKKVIVEVGQFLGKTLSEDQLRKLTEHLSFECMKTNRALNREPELELEEKYELREGGANALFMRSGQTGQWKDVMTSEMIQRFEEWEQEHLRNTDYPFHNLCT